MHARFMEIHQFFAKKIRPDTFLTDHATTVLMFLQVSYFRWKLLLETSRFSVWFQTRSSVRAQLLLLHKVSRTAHFMTGVKLINVKRNAALIILLTPSFFTCLSYSIVLDKYSSLWTQRECTSGMRRLSTSLCELDPLHSITSLFQFIFILLRSFLAKSNHSEFGLPCAYLQSSEYAHFLFFLYPNIKMSNFVFSPLMKVSLWSKRLF